MRKVERWSVSSVVAGLALMVLSSCSSLGLIDPGAANTDQTPSTTPSISPMSCDHLAPADDVAAALTDTDGIADAPVPAVHPTTDLADYVTAAAGGLNCSWRVGNPQGDPFATATDADWAYLTVDVLPQAGDSWATWVSQMEPENLVQITGIDAIAQCGDGGCDVDAAVEDVWLSVQLRAAGFGADQSRFDGTVAAQLETFAAAMMARIQEADVEELRWPQLATSGESGTCDGLLDAPEVAAALGIGTISYERTESSLAGSPADLVGLYKCRVADPELPYTSITVGHGLAPVLESLAMTPDVSTSMQTVELRGASTNDRALIACVDGTEFCSMLFSIGTTAYEVSSDSSVAIAEAMIAAAK